MKIEEIKRTKVTFSKEEKKALETVFGIFDALMENMSENTILASEYGWLNKCEIIAAKNNIDYLIADTPLTIEEEYKNGKF